MAEAESSSVDSSVVPTAEEKLATDVDVVLVGDSVLDNFFWLEDKSRDVAAQLRSSLASKGIKGSVFNFAVDESTSLTVLNGKTPGFMYTGARKKLGMPPYPIEKSGISKGKVMPLRLLERLVESRTAAMKASKKEGMREMYIVISVGGNDFRELLLTVDDQSELMAEMPSLLSELDLNVRSIVEKVQKLGNKQVKMVPVLVLCYEPRSDWLADSLPREVLLTVMDWGAQKVLSLVTELQCVLIDLARTFDPFDSTHYGSTEIEPSNVSGQFIVDLVLDIMAIDDDSDRESHMFYLKHASKKKGSAADSSTSSAAAASSASSSSSSSSKTVKVRITEESCGQFTHDLFARAGISRDSLDMLAMLAGDAFAHERERLLSLSLFDEDLGSL